MNCPLNISIQCKDCCFEKEGLCDYPYMGDVSVEELNPSEEQISHMWGNIVTQIGGN